MNIIILEIKKYMYNLPNISLMFSYGKNLTTNVPIYSFKNIFLFLFVSLCLSVSLAVYVFYLSVKNREKT